MKGMFYLFLITTFSTFSQDYQWVRVSEGYNASGAFIETTSDNRVVTVGNFHGTIDLDPGIGIDNHTTTSDGDVFIQKLDANGNFIWGKSFISTGGSLNTIGSLVGATSLKIANDGSIYICGVFTGQVDFDPGVDTYIASNFGVLTEQTSAFIVKLDLDGNFQWVKVYGIDDGEVILSDLILMNNKITLVGNYSGYGAVNFLTNFIVSNPSRNFILELNSDGNEIRVEKFDYYTTHMKINKGLNSELYITGKASNSVDFSIGNTQSIVSGGVNDGFICNLDNTDYALNWVKRFGDNNSVKINNFLVDSVYQAIYLTGIYYDTVNFSPNNGINNLIAQTTNNSSFLLKLNLNGDFNWVKNITGSTNIDVKDLALDNAGNIIVVGNFIDSIFSGVNQSTQLLNTQNKARFLMNFSENGNLTWQETLGASNYLVGASLAYNLVGDLFVTGTFLDTVSFNPINVLIDKYVAQNSNVYVQKWKGLGMSNNRKDNYDTFIIFPNPSSHSTHISFQKIGDYELKIYSSQGNLVNRIMLINESDLELNMDVKPGLYFIEVNTKDKKRILKFIKQ